MAAPFSSLRPPSRLSKRTRYTEDTAELLPAGQKEIFMPEEMLPAAQRESRKNPTSPASRGAEAIPATRERRSRRAYHPQRGKMRADCPLRRAADRVYVMRQ